MAKPTAQQCHALTSYYEKKYQEKYKSSPNVNRVTARWNFDSILSGSLNSVQVKELLDYYFTTPPTKHHDLDWFFYNYDKIVKSFMESRKDRAARAKLMEESRLRAERWRESGKQGITND